MKNLIITLLIIISNGIQAFPQGDSFTYQGKLIENSTPANGNYEMSVSLYTDAVNGTHLIGVNFLSVPVVNGIFTLNINFGDTEFMGDERWLELGVRKFNTPNMTVLTPRQLISNAPYAIQSQFVGTNGVDSLSIQNSAITSSKVANGAVTEQKLASNSVTTAKIATGAVTNQKMALNSIGSSHIVDGSIINNDIASETITSAQLSNNTITHFKIDTGAVRSDEILDGTIVADDINSNSVQQRIIGTCSTGSSIASILANGTVTCENDDIGNTGWGLTGNAGTTPGNNFIGTTDDKNLEFKINNVTALRLLKGTDSIYGIIPNVISGDPLNTILSNSSGSNISGGINNSINGSGSVISGGRNNLVNNNLTTIVGGFNHVNNAGQSFIGGGNTNKVNTGAIGSFIGGGSYNVASGSQSSIIGSNNETYGLNSVSIGHNNEAGGDYSFALGNNASVRNQIGVGSGTTGDEGTFIWSQTGVASTGSNQVLFEAIGGFGIGTNTPASPMHIKGEGKTYGALADEVVMTIEPKDSIEDVSLVINKLGTNKEAALAFTANKVPVFDIRNNTGGGLDFNSYESGTAQFMMRINGAAADRIDFNTNLEPWADDAFKLGSSTYRFSEIHATDINSTNPVNITSDRRLKDSIIELNYGLSEILNLKPVSYHLKNGGKERHLGLIAQEVEIIIPEIVNKANDENQTRSMRYTELVPVLIKATQEQQVLIDQQNQQIKELRILVNKLINEKSK